MQVRHAGQQQFDSVLHLQSRIGGRSAVWAVFWEQARNALRQVWNEDGKLVPESRYKANRSPEFIEAEIERLKAELDLKRGQDPLLSAPRDDDSKPERKTARERRIERLERASE